MSSNAFVLPMPCLGAAVHGGQAAAGSFVASGLPRGCRCLASSCYHMAGLGTCRQGRALHFLQWPLHCCCCLPLACCCRSAARACPLLLCLEPAAVHHFFILCSIANQTAGLPWSGLLPPALCQGGSKFSAHPCCNKWSSPGAASSLYDNVGLTSESSLLCQGLPCNAGLANESHLFCQGKGLTSTPSPHPCQPLP